LNKCGGIFVEGMESAQPEIMEYHEHMECAAKDKGENNSNELFRGHKPRGKKSRGYTVVRFRLTRRWIF